MLGHDLFVGRHHVLAALDGLQDQRPGRLLTTNDFDDDVDFRIVDNRQRIGNQRRGQTDRARLVRIADEHFADLHRAADASFERVALVQEHSGDAAADGPQAEQPNTQWPGRRHVGALASECVVIR